MLGKRKTIFNMIHMNAVDYSLADFERDAQKAARAGATHIMISQVEKSRWIWEADRSDPYPNWGMLNLAIFKAVVPPELKGFLPEDYAARNLATLKARSTILKQYGLKGAIQVCEPFYLPEAVFRAHPDWRGPRCEHPRRARNVYYSPCADHPEVLGMYRRAVAELLRQVEVDYIFIHTNDSGSGLCWSSGLYPGANGPAWCQHRAPAERIIGFLDAFMQGGRDAGREIDVEINSNIGFKEPEHAMDAVWSALKPHMAVNFRNHQGIPQTSVVDVGYEFSIAPVKNIPLVVGFLEKLEAAHAAGTEVASLILAESDHDEYLRVCEAFEQAPTCGLRDRAALLWGVAAQIAGEAAAGDLVEVWHKIQTGLLHFTDTNIEGLISCSVNQRWINRPFVLFPGELTPEERDYYRAFQFQAVDEAQANDLLNIQCTTFIRGYYAIFLASKALNRAMQANQAAIDILKRIAGGLAGQPPEWAALLADRLRLLNCFYRNALHAMKFQEIVDNTDYTRKPEISPRWPLDAEPSLLDYEAISRAEIDNTFEIIRLIEGRERQMLILAPTHEQEDIFLFSPRLVEQLRKKTYIMLDHFLDGKRLFVTHNH
ncbi:MAG TPA: hypothetical protein VIO61_00565 [Anaerolineaceae bacterium]